MIGLGRLAVATHVRLLREEAAHMASIVPPGDAGVGAAGACSGVADRLGASELETVCMSLSGTRRKIARLLRSLEATRRIGEALDLRVRS